MGELFVFEAIKQARSQREIPTDNSKKGIPYIVQSMFNNMVSRTVNKDWLIKNNEAPVSGNRIVLGVTLPAISYQPKEFGASQVITAKADWLNEKNGVYISASIGKLMAQFSYSKKPGLQIYKDMVVSLPTKKGKIDFEFMESFVAELSAQRVAELSAQRVAELSAHLKVTGLNDYDLTNEEQKVLEDFENGIITFSEFSFNNIFDKILQGRRLKKEDQITGDIPFVMAGTTNTGIVKYISNPVAKFPKNSITIDIFGNTFYRNYDFGAGDDTGVYWNSKKDYSDKTMLYLTSSISKLISGKFDFGNKLRSSQSLDFKVQLPSQNNKPNYELMETFIAAIQKLVIKDVVLYADRKIEATKSVINN